MKKIGITGQSGFIGTHLYNTLNLNKEKFQLIKFNRDYFNNSTKLDKFVTDCDVIIHLAAMNRHNNTTILYETNIKLVKQLINSLIKTKSNAHILFSSSSQEENDNSYGKSKLEGRLLFEKWAKSYNGKITGMIIPNVFGPFGKPFYNSVIATFSHQIANNKTPKIHVDGNLKLIYINELVSEFINKIENPKRESVYIVPNTVEAKVSKLLELLTSFKKTYQDKGEIPTLNTNFELNLFNTFRCYIDIENQFPIKYIQHKDKRGSFVEIIRLGIGGQVSFSTTAPKITRGNHFHKRKIERFSVIKGKALIQLRRIGTDKIFNYYLDGENPSYVDIPIWYTHNIKNIGTEILFTNFWINETYNENDTDTYFEEV